MSDRLESAEKRIDALERELLLIKNRHARYRKIQSLENKLKDALTALRELNQAIPFPLPEWFSEELQRKVVSVIHANP